VSTPRYVDSAYLRYDLVYEGISQVEHIDNPKGYAEGKDARTYDKRLRPPVDSKELEVDPLTGMKNYIANEAGHWDTSLAYVRRSLKSSIHFGRLYRLLGKVEWKWEAYRQLGSAVSEPLVVILVHHLNLSELAAHFGRLYCSFQLLRACIDKLGIRGSLPLCWQYDTSQVTVRQNGASFSHWNLWLQRLLSFVSFFLLLLVVQ